MRYLALLIALFLVGCGSDDEGTPASLSDIIGVWDASTREGQLIGEVYTVIKSDGSYITYDYDGDSFDNGDNCFNIYDGTLIDLGSGNFEIENGPSYYITVKGNTMTTNTTIDNQKISITATRSNRLESSFTPSCFDI